MQGQLIQSHPWGIRREVLPHPRQGFPAPEAQLTDRQVPMPSGFQNLPPALCGRDSWANGETGRKKEQWGQQLLHRGGVGSGDRGQVSCHHASLLVLLLPHLWDSPKLSLRPSASNNHPKLGGCSSPCLVRAAALHRGKL